MPTRWQSAAISRMFFSRTSRSHVTAGVSRSCTSMGFSWCRAVGTRLRVGGHRLAAHAPALELGVVRVDADSGDVRWRDGAVVVDAEGVVVDLAVHRVDRVAVILEDQ